MNIIHNFTYENLRMNSTDIVNLILFWRSFLNVERFCFCLHVSIPIAEQPDCEFIAHFSKSFCFSFNQCFWKFSIFFQIWTLKFCWHLIWLTQKLRVFIFWPNDVNWWPNFDSVFHVTSLAQNKTNEWMICIRDFWILFWRIMTTPKTKFWITTPKRKFHIEQCPSSMRIIKCQNDKIAM